MGKVIADGVDFKEAILHNVYASGANFIGSDFRGAQSMEGHFGATFVGNVKTVEAADFSHGDLRSFISRGTNFKGIKLVDTKLDASDTRINFRPLRQKTVSVCEGNCQNCVGCESPKKYETFGELASPGKVRTY